ncbi:MAG: hypothetical protein Fur0023_08350 [Bacteroidia bacterium]
METIKEKLINLYSGKWKKLKSEILEKNDSIECPHLLSTTEKFEKEWSESDIKMMIFGIKTNSWGADEDTIKDEDAIKHLMKSYEKFYFKGGNWKYAQTFWNYFYCIHELLKCRLNKKISVIWNNVHKIEGAPQEIEDQYFNVTLEEVKIFRPNVILLLGINERDTLLSKILGKINFNVDEYRNKDKSLYSLNTSNLSLEPEVKEYLKKIIITYHPNAHGKGGIKMKYLIEHLSHELNSL